MVSVDRSYDY